MFFTKVETMEQTQCYVNTDLYTSNIAVGGPGGGSYSLIPTYKEDPTWPMAEQITFYRDEQRMRGIIFKRYDSCTLQVGGSFSDPDPVTITLAKDEQLTRILLYSSDHTDPESPIGRFAGLRLSTTKKNVEVFAYGFAPTPSHEVEIPVGSGYWNGIFGKSGSDIDCFGIAMLKK